ncbi:MAG: hypothetical protein GX295_00725 [Syntrophomonadaceae bacterium]|nr:hypothetical protein [Syntrophomonadaceae bacterium]
MLALEEVEAMSNVCAAMSQQKSKNRYKILVEVVVDAESIETARTEVMQRLSWSAAPVNIVEVKEQEVFKDLIEEPEWDEEVQPEFTVVVEFTIEEAKHLYNLMRLVFSNLQQDPDFMPQMAEARTISKMIDALEDSLGDVLHVI